MRIKNVLRNCGAGFFNKIVVEIIRFAVRTVFIFRLSEAYLGANSLFSSILNVLNIVDLGIGGSIAFALYKPLAERDEEQVKALMALYRKAYRMIGLVIFGGGLCLLPFLPYIVKEQVEGLNLYILYPLHLFHSASSYFFFAYKSTLLTADQKNYKVTMISTLSSVFTAGGQIVILCVPLFSPAMAFYLYTAAGILGGIASNLFVARTVDRLYPYIREKDVPPIRPDIRKKLFQNIGALSISRISRVALDSIDSIIISASLSQGLSLNGKYSNYTLIVSFINSIFSQISSAVTASLGNYLVENGAQKGRNLFDCINLVFTWLYGFCFVCLWCLFNPFIGGVWITEEWLLSDRMVFLISLNFLLNGIDFAPMKFIQAAGLYWQARARYIISAVLNIFLSVLFGAVLGWGLEGVVFATSIALIGMTCLDPYVVFKHFFHERSFSYYFRYVISLVSIVATGALTNAVCSWLVPAYTLSGFLLRLLICILLPNLLWLAALCRTRLFKQTVSIIFNYIYVIMRKDI